MHEPPEGDNLNDEVFAGEDELSQAGRVRGFRRLSLAKLAWGWGLVPVGAGCVWVMNFILSRTITFTNHEPTASQEAILWLLLFSVPMLVWLWMFIGSKIGRPGLVWATNKFGHVTLQRIFRAWVLLAQVVVIAGVITLLFWPAIDRRMRSDFSGDAGVGPVVMVPYFSGLHLLRGAVPTVASLFLLYWLMKNPKADVSIRRSRWVHYIPDLGSVIGLVFTVFYVGLWLWSATQLQRVREVPWNDFDAQDEMLFGCLVKWFAPGFGTFTLLMAMLTGAGLLLQLQVLRWITGRTLAAIVLFLPWVSLCFYHFQPDATCFVFPMLNDYSLFPLRYFGPWAVGFVCAWYLRERSWQRAMVLSFFAALTAWCKLDFGFPAFVAAMVVILLTGSQGIRPGWRRTGTTLLLAGLSLILATGLWSGLEYAHSGQWSSVGRMIQDQTLMVPNSPQAPVVSPIRKIGLHHTIFLTLMGGITVALIQLNMQLPGAISTENDIDEQGQKLGQSTTLSIWQTSRQSRILAAGMLLYLGVGSIGPLAYFAARPQPEMLVKLFPVWGLSGAILAWLGWSSVSQNRARGKLLRFATTLFPAILCSFILMLGWSQFKLPQGLCGSCKPTPVSRGDATQRPAPRKGAVCDGPVYASRKIHTPSE